MSRYAKLVKKRKKSKNKGFLPPEVESFLARRLQDGIALALFLTGCLLLGALISYHPADPSWNMASGEKPANLIGLPGAYMADLFMQTLGYASYALPFIFAAWAYRLLRRNRLSPFPLRLLTALLAMMLLAAAFARIPAPHAADAEWFSPYMGGAVGTLLLSHLAGLLGFFTNSPPFIPAAFIAAILALPCLYLTFAVTKEERRAVTAALITAAKIAAFVAYDQTRRFIYWMRYHNRPEYDRPAPPVPKAPAPRKPAAPKASPQESKPTTAQTNRDIQVFAPSAQGAAKSRKTSQTPMNLDTDWTMPGLDLLQDVPENAQEQDTDTESLRQNAELLQSVLADFNIEGEIVSIHPGPVVTLYELEPAPGVKTSRVISLADDIARSMSAVSVRCAVVPGRNVIGIELPNSVRQTVYLRDIMESEAVEKAKGGLPLILGKDIGGRPIVADLAKMPHLLVAGTTGSGKSVAVNTMILSLLYRLPPEKCRLIMIDPKMLELSVYDDIPHLLSPVVTEPGKAVVALKWAVVEMENRYRAMSRLGVRNIEGYNERLREAKKKGETLMRKVQTGFDPDTGKPIFEDQPLDMTELPYIVIIVDEFADLMLVAGKDVENAVQRLAQMARAAGIHLIMATQRPSVDVITGIIKANFPTRISFSVTSKIDSRTILNEGGAEQLLGLGDMLYMAGGGRITRVHGPFVSDEDVENVVQFLKAQGSPSYIEDVTEGGFEGGGEAVNALFGDGEDGGESEMDELYDKAVAIVAREQKASTSFIQRHLQIGYNRAARIIEDMEKQGVIGPANHVGKRDVLISDHGERG